jgi:transcriptional regulator with XRE-family HTH domain
METLPEVGERVRALRKAAGLTQVKLAELVGIRQEALSRFESDRSVDFSLAKLLRLLQAVGADMDFQPATRRPTLTAILQERRDGTNVGPASR